MTSTISEHTGEIRPTLVLGGSGRLGQMLAAHWPSDAPLVRSSRGLKPEFVQFDLILEPDKAGRAMVGVGAVICLAGVTPAQVTIGTDVFSRNTDLALAAIRGAYDAGAGRVFIASSAAIYGAVGGVLEETAHCQPVSEYGITKLEMEAAALELAHTLGHTVTILRIGNVAGADAILGGWRTGMTIDQLANGCTPERSYIGPQTLARVLHVLCNADDLPEVLNIAAPGAVEMGALLDAADLQWSPRPAPQTAIANVTLSTRRLETHVTFAAENSTPAGLVAEWRAYQAQMKAHT